MFVKVCYLSNNCCLAISCYLPKWPPISQTVFVCSNKNKTVPLVKYLAKRTEPWVFDICNAKLFHLPSFSYVAVLIKDGVTGIKKIIEFNMKILKKKRFVGDNDSSVILC